MKTLMTVLCALAALSWNSAQATLITITDPTGDHTGAVDVTGMSLDIDSTTGAYSIVLTADAANPFAPSTSAFRVNINLFNTTRNELFQDGFNDFPPLGVDSATQLTLTGTDANLTDWLDTDIIATSTLAGLGNPPGSTSFRTAVSDLPFSPICSAEDIIGLDGCDPVGVPAPATLLLLGIGLASLGVRRRR